MANTRKKVESMVMFEQSQMLSLSRHKILTDEAVEETLYDALFATHELLKQIQQDSFYRDDAIMHLRSLTDSLKTVVESIVLFQEAGKN